MLKRQRCGRANADLLRRPALLTPMGLAILLGHRWNRIAPTIVHEDVAALGYEAAFTVSA